MLTVVFCLICGILPGKTAKKTYDNLLPELSNSLGNGFYMLTQWILMFSIIEPIQQHIDNRQLNVI